MQKYEVKSKEEWIKEAKLYKKPYLFFQGYCLDLAKFINMHPGGQKVITNYFYKDITDILFHVFPHNHQTVPKLLQKYRIGQLKQPPHQKKKLTGTILKQRNQFKQNTIEKKIVQFPSQVKKLASEKQKIDQIKRSLSKKSRNQKSKSKNVQNFLDQKINKKTKNMNQDYVNTLKGSKQIQKNDKKQQKQNIQNEKNNLMQNSITHEVSIVNNLMQSTSNISIKNHLKKISTWGLLPQNVDQPSTPIKIPVLTVKVNKIW